MIKNKFLNRLKTLFFDPLISTLSTSKKDLGSNSIIKHKFHDVVIGKIAAQVDHVTPYPEKDTANKSIQPIENATDTYFYLDKEINIFNENRTIISDDTTKPSLNYNSTPTNYQTLEKLDLVFIDNDKTLCEAWKIKAEFVNKKILCFNSIKEFQLVMEQIPQQTPIYIDSDLGNNQLGEYISKELYDAGYKIIFLSTGKSSLSIKKPYWIKDIVEKYPPF